MHFYFFSYIFINLIVIILLFFSIYHRNYNLFEYTYKDFNKNFTELLKYTYTGEKIEFNENFTNIINLPLSEPIKTIFIMQMKQL